MLRTVNIFEACGNKFGGSFCSPYASGGLIVTILVLPDSSNFVNQIHPRHASAVWGCSVHLDPLLHKLATGRLIMGINAGDFFGALLCEDLLHAKS